MVKRLLVLLLLAAAGHAQTMGSNIQANGTSVSNVTPASLGPVSCPLVNGTNLCLTQPPYNADPTGANDATTSLQNAVNALATTGGTIHLPCGIFALNGAMQDTAGANATITMPKIPNYQGPLIDITIEGCNRPDWDNPTAANTTTFSTTQTTGRMIGGYDSAQGGGFPGFTDVKLHIRNVRFSTPSAYNGVVVAGDYLQGLDIQHVLFNCGGNCGGASWAARFPTLGNEVENYVDDVQEGNFYNAYNFTEHTTVGSVYAVYSTNCFVFGTGSNSPGANGVPSTYAGNSINVQHLWEQDCTNAIVNLDAASTPTTVNIASADLELTGTNGVSDPNNNLHGILNFYSPYAPRDSIPVSGAANLTMIPLYDKGSAGSNPTFVNNSGSATATVSTTSTSYAEANYDWAATNAHSFGLTLYNGYNDTSHAGVFALGDSTELAASSPTTAGYPWLYNTTGDLCFLVPVSSTSLNTCQGAVFRLNHDGTTVGFSGNASGATQTYGVPTLNPNTPSSVSVSLRSGFSNDDHAFTFTVTPNTTIGANTLFAEFAFGKTFYNSAGTASNPNCSVTGYGISGASTAATAYIGAITSQDVGFSTGPGSLASGTSYIFSVVCLADHEQ